MTWQVLIGLSVISNSISVLLQRVILKESYSRPIAYSIFYQLLIGVLIGVFGLFTSDMSFPNNWKTLLPNLILMVIFYGFGNLLIFKSLKETEASKFTIIFSLRAFFTTFGSFLLLREFLTLNQYIGAVLIFASVVLVSFKSQKLTLKRGELYAFLAALCFGLANTNDRYLLMSFQVYPFLVLAFSLPALLIALIYHQELKYIKIFLNKKLLINIALLCLIYGFTAITFFSALQLSNNSSQVANINISSVIITVVLSIIFLKERKNYLKKLIAAILTFAGVYLLK